MRFITPAVAALITALAVAAPATAQSLDPDRQYDLGQPDFTLSALPTTLRLPANTFAFRLTHRFTRPIDSGTTGDFFRDFFGFDSASKIGIELRYGLRPGTQVAIHRTNDRAIQLSGQQTMLRQTAARWIGVDGVLAVEGADNFTENYSGTIGAVVSHVFAGHGALYAHPLYVWNVGAAPLDTSGQEWTASVGVGARWRLGGSHVYVVAEAAPQVAGGTNRVDHVSFGIERRAGGHLFQFTVANGLGTTYRQVVNGGANRGDWYVGFNLSRKFY